LLNAAVLLKKIKKWNKINNSMKTLIVDICVIGAGSGGLSVASGAAQLGAQTVLIEEGAMGGDCLNSGCVPSKALISAAKSAQSIRTASKFGVNADAVTVDFQKVHDHVHGVIETIAPIDSVERFEGLGVKVIQSRGRFIDPKTVEAGDYKIRARRFVVATGSRAAIPPIKGISQTPYLTNESIFSLKALPGHLVVIGGGPIGVELAQAFVRLGSKVTLLEAATIMVNDDPELVSVVRESLVRDGVDLREGAAVQSVSADGPGVKGAGIQVSLGENGETIEGTHLLIAAGRSPNVDDLGLEAAGIEFDRRGVKVDHRLRTSNKKAFAIGDVAGGLQFTHVAGYHAGLVIRNALFRVPAKTDLRSVPWVTYADPELAHVGLTEATARADFGSRVKVLKWKLDENDRAQTERDTRGFIKVILGPKARILGASIVGAGAGELLLPWILAISQRMKIGAFTSIIAPYPTRGEISKRAAGDYYTPTLFSPRTRFLVKVLSWFG
jgi:pyruvate/2-oxoglutarate dehydrogenase complex dihydrolipoamide dehydrogenase (E3) component